MNYLGVVGSPEEALARAAASVGGCLLCGGRREYLGAFVPHEPGRYGGPVPKEGRERSYWYGLCVPCSLVPGFEDRVEAVLLAETARERN